MTDNVAMLAGYTRNVLIEGDYSSFQALVRPDQDFDDAFRCYDTDSQEWLVVSGWLISSIEELD